MMLEVVDSKAFLQNVNIHEGTLKDKRCADKAWSLGEHR